MASSESLSTSLRSSELRNLQQLVENPITEICTTLTSTTTTITGGINIIDGQRVTPQTLDLASSANTATNVLNLITEQKELNSPDNGATLRLTTTTTSIKAVVSSSSSHNTTATSISSSINPTTTHMHAKTLQPSSSKTITDQQTQSSQSRR